MKTPLLRATKLCKSFKRPIAIEIVNDLNLEVYAGDTVAIVGKSGQGKSTLIQTLGTLEPYSKGKLEIEGAKVSFFNRSQIRGKSLGFVFQSFHLLEDFTVLENILMPAKILRKSTSKHSPIWFRAQELLDYVGLKERSSFHVKLLSGGEKQRVAIARALLNEPNIIFADEPSGNLDAETAAEVHTLLINYAKREGKALVLVTHDPALASLCNRRFELFQGELKPQLPAETILAQTTESVIQV